MLMSWAAFCGRRSCFGLKNNSPPVRSATPISKSSKTEPWTRPSLVNVIVQDGTVELWGIVESASEKKAVRIAAEVTPGVRAINDNLIIRPAQWGY